MLRLVSEVPVQEDTLMRVMIIGLTRELGVNAADALELADQLIRRAAMLSNEGTSQPAVNSQQSDFICRLKEYA